MRLLCAGLLLLASFAAHGQGSATLSCTPPTQNSNGTPLTDLASYKFYEGMTQGSYSNSVVRPSSSGCGYVFSNLAAGTHYFVASSINATGVEGMFSNVASKTIAGTTPPPPPPPPPPPVPTALAVTSTRIDAAEWTCRDSAGVILTSHTRADKAQEACTNFALKNPGKVYEMRPSGYRITAQ